MDLYLQEAQAPRDRSLSLASQISISLPSLAPSPAPVFIPISVPPPFKGLAPAPLLPTTVQQRPPNPQQFVVFNSSHDGHWAVQQAVRSVESVLSWDNVKGGDVHDISTENCFVPQFSNASATCQQQHVTLLSHNPQPLCPSGYQPDYQHSPPSNMFLSYVNHAGPPAFTDPSPLGTEQPPPPVGRPSCSEVFADDPSVIRANIMDFNAMVQMQNDSAVPFKVAPTTVATDIHTNQPPLDYPDITNVVNVSIDKMVIIPLSQADGSIILTGPQRSMYCTTSAQPFNVESMDPSMLAMDGKVGRGFEKPFLFSCWMPLVCI